MLILCGNRHEKLRLKREKPQWIKWNWEHTILLQHTVLQADKVEYKRAHTHTWTHLERRQREKKGFHWGSLPEGQSAKRVGETDRVREQESPYIATGRAVSGQEAPCLGMEVSWPAGRLTFPMLVGFLESRIAWRFLGWRLWASAGKGQAWFLLSASTLSYCFHSALCTDYT